VSDLRAQATLLLTVAGHYFTLAPVARHMVRPRSAPRSAPFELLTEDKKLGPIRLTGRIHHAASDDLLVLVHGLGGSIDSHYMLEAVRAAEAAGIACLRVNIRGSDRTGEDIYHAALTEDLHAALASPEIARYRRIHLLGYSLGGHIVLYAATEDIDRRVRSVAAVCPVLDLHSASRAIDEPRRLPYRRHVLNAIKDVYAAVARRREALPLPLAEALRIRTLREWDERIVVPRFGYDSVEHYYDEASVAPRLGRLEVPSLVVAARHDPMVPAHTLVPVLESAGPPLEARWIERGGHVGFPSVVDLGMPGAQSLEDQLVAWHLRCVE
jgi:hypothetical protein